MKDIKERIRAKIPKEDLEYNDFYQVCQKCHKETMHYGSECLYLYCSECGFVTSDDLNEVVEQLDLEA